MPSLLLLLLLLLLPSSSSASPRHRTCAPPPSSAPCPPFHSPPSSFPFASVPGCGHPSFQIHCSSPHSLLFIDSSPFLLLSLLPPSSLLLSPFFSTPTPPQQHLHCPSLPSRPIDLSGSPFRLLSDPCPFLASLRPCSPSPPLSSPSCPLSSFQRRLLSNPHLLFSSCHRRQLDLPACRPSSVSNIAENLTEFLNSGIRVVWDSSGDPYFSNCSSCSGSCAFDDSLPSKPFLCLLSPSSSSAHSHSHRTLLLAISLLTLFLFFSFLTVALLQRWRPGRGRRGGDLATTAFIQCQFPRPPPFSFEQLRAATNGFDPKRKIGDGGFGSVFLAHLPDGRAAAVKRLHPGPNRAISSSSFCNEVFILSSLHHPNLVRLHGYCCDPRALLLVFDYVPNGTLADHLHRNKHSQSLSWPLRLDIAVQIAAALEYLHFDLKPPVVHRDITSSNIFLERDMRVKVGDFGLSRLLAQPEDAASGEYVRCTGPQGTPGYLDPEYHRSFRLTEKSDVYSFGVVMLELVTGLKAVDTRRDEREVSLAQMVVGRIQIGMLHQVLDPMLVGDEDGPAVRRTIEAVAELAFRCVAGDKDDRPDAREVVEELRRIRNLLNDGNTG